LFLAIIPIALAMNLWMSNNIFYDIEVEKGFHGYYTVNLSEKCGYDWEWISEQFVRWGTRDNQT